MIRKTDALKLDDILKGLPPVRHLEAGSVWADAYLDIHGQERDKLPAREYAFKTLVEYIRATPRGIYE